MRARKIETSGRAAHKVDFSGSVELSTTARAFLRRAVKAALQAHNIPRARIGLCVLSDQEMAVMNEQHLGHEGPTDVLTFDLREQGTCDLEGEIALSVDTARREGREREHSVETELALYSVHGVLHLLGYDDHTKVAAARMHDMEDRILESLGLGAVFAGKRGSLGRSGRSEESQGRIPVRPRVGRSSVSRARSADGSQTSRCLH